MDAFPKTIFVRRGSSSSLVAGDTIASLLGGMGDDPIPVGEYRLVRELRAKPVVQWYETPGSSSSSPS